ncbi:MAG: hypothetical protein SCALA702_13710 [Melioribacteraceae bacterium]|nr:MAG: hypothetical protein SCALA702_13710 [Melioribacteraceae bacterium]
MRHRVKGRKLGRTATHRAATKNALVKALFLHKKIKTTVAKAKETRVFAEKLITKAKTDSVANRRYVARFINDRDVVKELFEEIVPTIGDRPGGYTRVIKLGFRAGDAAETAIIELVDYNDVGSEPKAAKTETAEVEEVEVEDVKTETTAAVEEAEVVEEVTEEKEEPKAETPEATEEPKDDTEEDKKEETK